VAQFLIKRCGHGVKGSQKRKNVLNQGSSKGRVIRALGSAPKDVETAEINVDRC